MDMTHGAIYSQFGSKEAIAAEAIRLALRESKQLWQRLVERKGAKQAFAAIVAAYLSHDHRDAPGQGCAAAALGSEIARQPKSVRDAFTEELKTGLEFLAGVIPGDDRSRKDEEAITVFASMVGALVLARAVNDEPLSEQILQATAKRISQSIKALTPAQRTQRSSGTPHSKAVIRQSSQKPMRRYTKGRRETQKCDSHDDLSQRL
jgi:TetR/AcrR family transcriptional repressor of nem operon